MSKRACTQRSEKERIILLKRWKAHSEWSLEDAARELDVKPSTLKDWRNSNWNDLDVVVGSDRVREKGGGRPRRMKPYETQVIQYYRSEKGSRRSKDVLVFCRGLEEFIQDKPNPNSQKSWVREFIKYYSNNENRPISAASSSSQICPQENGAGREAEHETVGGDADNSDGGGGSEEGSTGGGGHESEKNGCGLEDNIGGGGEKIGTGADDNIGNSGGGGGASDDIGSGGGGCDDIGGGCGGSDDIGGGCGSSGECRYENGDLDVAGSDAGGGDEDVVNRKAHLIGSSEELDVGEVRSRDTDNANSIDASDDSDASVFGVVEPPKQTSYVSLLKKKP